MLNVFLTYGFALILSEVFIFHSVAFKFCTFNFGWDFLYVPAEKLEEKKNQKKLEDTNFEILLPNGSSNTGFESNSLVHICS